MTSDEARLQQALASHKCSLTHARRTVFHALHASEPLTMNELVQKCEQDIDRASVYRSVHLFEQFGIIHRILRGWKYTLELSDDFQHHHHHMHCLVCGKTTTLPEDQLLEVRLRRLAATHGFDPQSHTLEITGSCQDCHIQ